MYKSYVDNSAKHKAVAIYILPYVLCFLVLLTFAQIASLFVDIKQLNKISGSITDIHTTVVGYTHQRFGPDRPDYGLVFKLNNGLTYDIQDRVARAKLTTVLNIGDYVIIYSPSMLYKILSLGFVDPVEQVEWKDKVLYSFDDEKQGSHIMIAFLSALLIGTFFWRRSWIKGDY